MMTCRMFGIMQSSQRDGEKSKAAVTTSFLMAGGFLLAFQPSKAILS